jgi:hypothetical protein
LDQHVKPFEMGNAEVQVLHCEDAFGFNKKQDYSKQLAFIW